MRVPSPSVGKQGKKTDAFCRFIKRCTENTCAVEPLISSEPFNRALVCWRFRRASAQVSSRLPAAGDGVEARAAAVVKRFSTVVMTSVRYW